MDLFDYMREQNMNRQNARGEGPLASRLRPDTLDEIVGQEHIIGKDKLLYRAIRAAEISAEGKSIFSYDPKGKVADAYGKLTKEVMMNAEKRRKRQLEECR